MELINFKSTAQAKKLKKSVIELSKSEYLIREWEEGYCGCFDGDILVTLCNI